MAGKRYKGLDDFKAHHPELWKVLRIGSHPFLVSIREQIEDRQYISEGQLRGVRKFLPSTQHPIPDLHAHVTITAAVYGIHTDDRGRETFKWRSDSTGWNGRLEMRPGSVGMCDDLRERVEVGDHAIPVVITGQVVWLPDNVTGFMIIRGEWIDAENIEPDELDKIEHPFDVEDDNPDELLDALGAPPKGTPPPRPEGVRARLAVSNGDTDWMAAIRKKGQK